METFYKKEYLLSKFKEYQFPKDLFSNELVVIKELIYSDKQAISRIPEILIKININYSDCFIVEQKLCQENTPKKNYKKFWRKYSEPNKFSKNSWKSGCNIDKYYSDRIFFPAKILKIINEIDINIKPFEQNITICNSVCKDIDIYLPSLNRPKEELTPTINTQRQIHNSYEPDSIYTLASNNQLNSHYSKKYNNNYFNRKTM